MLLFANYKKIHDIVIVKKKKKNNGITYFITTKIKFVKLEIKNGKCDYY